MGGVSSTPEKSPLATHPVNVDVTKQYGSGAEQDRFGQHFAGAGAAVADKIKEGVQELGSTRSSGAEQDRYGARFGTGDELKNAARSGFEKTKEAASSGYEKTKDAASSQYEKTRDAARTKFEQTKNAASSGYEEAKDKAERGYDQAKDAAERGYGRAKDALEQAIKAKGSGAEQDRYGSHFDFTSLDLKPVTKAAMSIIHNHGNLSAASGYGLGYDGWQRAKYLAAYKGAGAEQDRYEARFGAIGQQATQAIKDKFNELRK